MVDATCIIQTIPIMAGLKERVRHRQSHSETTIPPSFRTDTPDPVEAMTGDVPKHLDPVERDRDRCRDDE